MFVSSLAPGNYNLIITGARSYADRLFWRRYVAAQFHAVLAKLLGGSVPLQPLALARQGTFVKNSRHAGVQLVALDEIRGSENRSDDFDAAFRPLHRRMQQRWVNVASAWLHGAVFEPVQLVQIGADYFVRDGHHRISVARATGQHYIDAEVTVLDLGRHPVPSTGLRLATRSQSLNQGALAPTF